MADQPPVKGTRTRFLASAPIWMLHTFNMARWLRKETWGLSSDSAGAFNSSTETDVPAFDPQGQAISSLTGLGTHNILIDIDRQAALIPSSTEGHWHLIIPATASWPKVEALLDALLALGIIDSGYHGICVKRQQTYLRLPWITKGSEVAVDFPDEQTVLRVDEWLLSNGRSGGNFVHRPGLEYDQTLPSYANRLKGKTGKDQSPNQPPPF